NSKISKITISAKLLLASRINEKPTGGMAGIFNDPKIIFYCKLAKLFKIYSASCKVDWNNPTESSFGCLRQQFSHCIYVQEVSFRINVSKNYLSTTIPNTIC